MASEDVIELGSSDEEAEPAAKRMKPTPNAMVHIPHPKFSGITIKPAISSQANAAPKSLLAGKPITVTKVANPFAARKKNHSAQLAPIPIPIRQLPHTSKQVKVPINTGFPKVVIMNKTDSPVVNNKLSGISKPIRNVVKERQNSKTLSKLPSSITVKRTVVNPMTTKIIPPKNPAFKNIVTNQKLSNKKIQIKKNLQRPREIMTVELDDDEVSTPSTASPQWYLRPEEQVEMEKLEKKNNEEPNTSNFIEITIEDSPVKPLEKRTHEVGAELAITIDDSPVKGLSNENKCNTTESDEENDVSKKDPHSKKKLEYPKEVVEIEIEGIAIGNNFNYQTNACKDIHLSKDTTEDKDTTKNKDGAENKDKIKSKDVAMIESENIVEIQESPIKTAPDCTINNSEISPSKSKNLQTSTPKKTMLSPKKQENKDNNKIQSKTESEFHPVYQEFIDLCFKIENSDDMKKIVEKKIKAYYRQVPKDYTESEEFIDMVSSKILSMKAGPEKMYLYIKDVVDELNLQRKIAKSQAPKENAEVSVEKPEKLTFAEDSEFDSKKQRQIRKLEKTLKKLHRAIQKLEEQEVDFDDEEDSVYLLTESEDGSSGQDKGRPLEKDHSTLLKRYKERMVRVHAKFCQLTNTKMPSEPRVHIESRPGRPTGPAKRLEKWVNRKVPIGTPLPFPDFHDVLKCVREANEQDKLRWNEADIMEEARDLFTRCGKKLQRRRQENEWRLAASRLPVDIDPAEDSSDLKTKLEKNRQVGAVREIEVLDKYADRQNKLKLEAEEIGDKEAEESPPESDDDEPNDEATSLENKEKRKERLKRLLQEKSKKPVEEKENQPTKSNEENASDVEMIDTEVKEPKNDVEKEATAVDNVSSSPKDKTETEDKKETEKGENVQRAQSISDDNYNIESDIDELHLLQKLHSSEVNTSTVESSDSESPIAISDTLESGSDNKEKISSDVISIENSSYSESENKDNTVAKDNKDINSISKKLVKDLMNINMEVECSSAGVEKKNNVTTNNDEYNESIEDILLASSDDEAEKGKEQGAEGLSDGNGCINLRDDSLSIGETIVQETVSKKDKEKVIPKGNDLETDTAKEITDSSSVESVVILSTNDPSENKEGSIRINDDVSEKSKDSLPATKNMSSDTKDVDQNTDKSIDSSAVNKDLVNKDTNKNSQNIDGKDKVCNDVIQKKESESRIQSMEVDNEEPEISVESTNVETNANAKETSSAVVESGSSDENVQMVNDNDKITQSPMDTELSKSDAIHVVT